MRKQNPLIPLAIRTKMHPSVISPMLAASCASQQGQHCPAGSGSSHCGPHGRFPAQAAFLKAVQATTQRSALKNHTKCAPEWFLKIVFNLSPLHMQSKRRFKDTCRFEIAGLTGDSVKFPFLQWWRHLLFVCSDPLLHVPLGAPSHLGQSLAHLILDILMLANWPF